MSDYLATAREAYRLFMKSKPIAEIGKQLGIRYAVDTRRAIDLGARDAWFEHQRLTDDEIALLISVAEWERRGIARGETCSPKTKHVGPWHWRGAKAARVARRRLDRHRSGEDRAKPGSGLGLVDAYHGGYIRLTAAGWAIVHALESERAKRKVADA